MRIITFSRGFPGGSDSEESTCNVKTQVWSLGWKGPLEKDRLPTLGFPGDSVGKESGCNVRDLASITGLGRSPGRRWGNPFQYSCLMNPHEQRSLVGCSPRGRRDGHN